MDRRALDGGQRRGERRDRRLGGVRLRVSNRRSRQRHQRGVDAMGDPPKHPAR